MQDFDAVLADPGQAFTDLRVRLTGPSRSRPHVASAARERLPGLLDTRLVRAELARLRAFPPLPGRCGADGRRGA